MLIPLLAIYHKKGRHGLPKKERKKEREKKNKSSIVQKREKRENKVAMLSKRS
jgi:hypothetical protein